MTKWTYVFLWLAASLAANNEAFVLQGAPAFGGCRIMRRSVSLQSSSSSSSSTDDEESSISHLIEEYRQLQDQLRADLEEGRQFDASYDAEALHDKEMQITALQIQEQEEKATAAQSNMQHAIEDAAKAKDLKDQALEETKWAIDEVSFLESIDSKHTYAELETLLLAHAAHDLKETDDLLSKVEEEKQQALRQEVRAKDLLWYLVQKEENLKELRAPHNKKELEKWAKHELPKDESMVKVLRKKLIDHDPTKGHIAFW